MGRIRRIAVAALVFAGAPHLAVACGFDQWSQVATTGEGVHLRAAGPASVSPVRRYSAQCAMIADEAGNYVTDLSPVAEPKFYVRFYVYVDATGGPVTLFQAKTSGSVVVASARFNGSSFEFATRGGYVASAAIERGRWYSIQLDWTAGSPMVAKVQGAGGAAFAAVQTSASQATDRIESTVLGWIAGTANGSFTVDAYEARRLTPTKRLCRGNADGTLSRGPNDEVLVKREFLRGMPANGEPDCNEDGRVDAGDLVCLRNLHAAGQDDCDAFPDL